MSLAFYSMSFHEVCSRFMLKILWSRCSTTHMNMHTEYRPRPETMSPKVVLFQNVNLIVNKLYISYFLKRKNVCKVLFHFASFAFSKRKRVPLEKFIVNFNEHPLFYSFNVGNGRKVTSESRYNRISFFRIKNYSIETIRWWNPIRSGCWVGE